ncbi:hypothetical protein AtEden1_Chr1g0035201 [Arabidopsis thaliana]
MKAELRARTVSTESIVSTTLISSDDRSSRAPRSHRFDGINSFDNFDFVGRPFKPSSALAPFRRNQ